MTISTLTSSPTIVSVKTSDDTLSVSLSDGRVVGVPISWYPRLSHALVQHLQVWELAGGGHGIHWPERLCLKSRGLGNLGRGASKFEKDHWELYIWNLG